MELKKYAQKSRRMIEHHIKSNGDSHASVDRINAGFMTPEMLGILDRSTNFEWIDSDEQNKVDVLALDSGNYEMLSTINGITDDHVWQNYIIHRSKVEYDGRYRKTLLAWVSASPSVVLIRNIHVSGDGFIDTDWKKLTLPLHTDWESLAIKSPFEAVSGTNGLKIRKVGENVNIRGAFTAVGERDGAETYTIAKIPGNMQPAGTVVGVGQGGLANRFRVSVSGTDLQISRYGAGENITIPDKTYMAFNLIYLI